MSLSRARRLLVGGGIVAVAAWLAIEHRAQADIDREVALALDSVRSAFPALRSTMPRVVLARSRAHAARLNGGAAVPGIYLPDSHTIVLARDGVTNTLLRHELTHAVLFEAWGAPAPSAEWVAEGIATLVGGRCSGRTPRELAGVLRRIRRLPAYDDLANRFRSLDQLEAYLAAASAVEWTLATEGVGGLERLWRVDRATFDESGWLHFIDTAPRVAWSPAHGCGVAQTVTARR